MVSTRLLFVTALLALWAACDGAVSCHEKTVHINSLQTFKELHNCSVKQAYAVNIELECDLDFSQWGEDYLPFGQSKSGYAYPYSGVFNGNGHTISNLVINRTSGSGEDAGLFARMENAAVSNLFFESSCLFRGAFAAPLVVSMGGDNNTIVNVNSEARVEGCAVAGGIVARLFLSSQSSVLIERCRNTGNVTVAMERSMQWYSAGGIVGYAFYDLDSAGLSQQRGHQHLGLDGRTRSGLWLRWRYCELW